MTEWQFLLDEKGKANIIPVNTDHYELPAGYYRIIAQSNLPNTLVEIRLEHQTEPDELVERFSHKYLRSTNADGLLIITPFLELKEGHLKLRCQGDILAELAGNLWQKYLSLKIISHDEIHKVNDQNQRIQLILEKDTLVKSSQATVSLSGIIESNYSKSTIQGRITYSLWDPKTGSILISYKETLSQSNLPILFKYELELKPEWETCLILGEIHLEVFQGESTFKESQYFSIISNYNQLYQRLKQLEYRLKPSPYLHLELLHLQQTQTFDSICFKYEPCQVLPPKINNHSIQKKEKNNTLKLPKISPFCPVHTKINTSQDICVDKAFDKLKLEDRFWSRLSFLANLNR